MKIVARTLLYSVLLGARKIKNHGILASVVLLTVILGFVGFSTVFPEFGPLTRIYMTMQLFLLDPQSFDVSDVISGSEEADGGVPWTLECARWMAALLTASGVLYAAWKLLQKSSGAFRIERLEHHLIVFGSGAVVQDFLERIVTTKADCVVVSQDSALTEKWRGQGGLAVEVEPSHEGQLAEEAGLRRTHFEKAGFERASKLYALDSSDAANLRAGMLADDLPGKAGMIIRQDEPFACDLLQRNGILSPAGPRSLRVVSIAKARARVLLREAPLEWSEPHGLASEVNLVMPRLGLFEKAMAIEAALVSHYADGGRLNLWLDSESARTGLLADFPGIARCINVRVIGEEGVLKPSDLLEAGTESSQVTVLATDVSPEEGYLRALRLREACPGGRFRVVLAGPLPGNTAVVAGITDLFVAPSAGGVVTPGALDEIDRVAERIHMTWYEGNQRRIDEAAAAGRKEDAQTLASKATFRSWNELTEEQKDANRTAADHLEIKIRAVGLDPAQADLEEAWSRLTKEQLNMLSRMEHERWAAPLWLANYQAGKRDDAARRHPNLVSYDALDQSTKDYDLEQVRRVPHYLGGLS